MAARKRLIRNILIRKYLGDAEMRECVAHGAWAILRGAVGASLLPEDNFTALATFLDRAPRRDRGQNTYMAIGVPNGALIVKNWGFPRLNDPIGHVCFCDTFARKLGLTPGKVRYFKVKVLQ